jgi:hypothetical protein
MAKSKPPAMPATLAKPTVTKPTAPMAALLPAPRPMPWPTCSVMKPAAPPATPLAEKVTHTPKGTGRPGTKTKTGAGKK